MAGRGCGPSPDLPGEMCVRKIYPDHSLCAAPNVGWGAPRRFGGFTQSRHSRFGKSVKPPVNIFRRGKPDIVRKLPSG